MNRKEVFEAIAASLREFGYPDASAEMVADTWAAMEAGEDLPHGIVGQFAERQLSEVADYVRSVE